MKCVIGTVVADHFSQIYLRLLFEVAITIGRAVAIM